MLDLFVSKAQLIMHFENSQDHSCVEAFPVPGYVAANHPQQVLKRNPSSSTVTKKQRQTACKTRKAVIAKYKQDVSLVWKDATSLCKPWFRPSGLNLDCKSIDPDNLPVGFTHVGDDRYQYNFTDPSATTKARRYRPAAYRVPFIEHIGYDDKALTVSHLCHNKRCYNWNHHTLESLEINKARNGCPAGPSCRHKTKCLIPGPFSGL